jgi:hypothetical protein
MSIIHTILHTLHSPQGEVFFETSIDSEDDAMSVWFVPNKNQGIQFIAIRSGLVLSRKPQNTDRKEAREIWNRLVQMDYTS